MNFLLDQGRLGAGVGTIAAPPRILVTSGVGTIAAPPRIIVTHQAPSRLRRASYKVHEALLRRRRKSHVYQL